MVNAFYVKRILIHLVEKGGQLTRYLVRWRGYLPSHYSWEPRSQLMTDVPGLVESFGDAHPMVRRSIVKGAPEGLIDGLQICNRVTHLGGDVIPFPGLPKRVFFSLSPHRVGHTTRERVTLREA